ncbi:MAG: transposase [Limisphaerales bacterium]
MANTYTCFHYHLVFSTKNREQWITPDIEQRIWTYIGGIAREKRMKPVQIGGIEDHVHVLVGAPASLAPATIAQLIE